MAPEVTQDGMSCLICRKQLNTMNEPWSDIEGCSTNTSGTRMDSFIEDLLGTNKFYLAVSVLLTQKKLCDRPRKGP